MAEGGEWRPDDDEWKTEFWNKMNSNDDKEEVNVTGPFVPGSSSTPYHRGQEVEMQTQQHEHSGLPDTSYAETPLLGDFFNPEEKQSRVDRAIDFIKSKFPKVDFKKLGPIGFSKKGSQADIVSFGPNGGENQIFKKDGSGLLKSFTDKFSKSLGSSAEQVIIEDRDTIQEQRQRLEEAEKQQREAETIAAEREKELREMENLKQQTERTQARIDALQQEHGSNLESEAELRRLKQLKKNHQTEYENKKKRSDRA